jgi:hypothetical protein
MNPATAAKLRRHIELTGRYEPLTIRPYPYQMGKYQVINGHNRLRVLRDLGHTTVHCVVWSINDDQTRLYLATQIRLSGDDTPERRAMLIENLCKTYNSEELLSLLPDNAEQAEKLRKLSGLKPDELNNLEIIADKIQPCDLIIQKDQELSRSQALLQLARFYLDKQY